MNDFDAILLSKKNGTQACNTMTVYLISKGLSD